MTRHLSSDHIWQVDVEGYLFNCVVFESAGHYFCCKVKGVSENYNKLTPALRKGYREQAGKKAEELCKLKAKGLYIYEQNS